MDRPAAALALANLLVTLALGLGAFLLLGSFAERSIPASVAFLGGLVALVWVSQTGVRRLQRRLWPSLGRRYERANAGMARLACALILLPVALAGVVRGAGEGDWTRVLVNGLLVLTTSYYLYASRPRAVDGKGPDAVDAPSAPC